jgi:hypothetical protein
VGSSEWNLRLDAQPQLSSGGGRSNFVPTSRIDALLGSRRTSAAVLALFALGSVVSALHHDFLVAGLLGGVLVTSATMFIRGERPDGPILSGGRTGTVLVTFGVVSSCASFDLLWLGGTGGLQGLPRSWNHEAIVEWCRSKGSLSSDYCQRLLEANAHGVTPRIALGDGAVLTFTLLVAVLVIRRGLRSRR